VSPSIVVLILGLVFMKLVFGGSHRHWRQTRDPLMDEKVTRLEAVVADLQEQLDQDRAALARLEEERSFYAQLYPGQRSERTT
jgi:hypothetical protein